MNLVSFIHAILGENMMNLGINLHMNDVQTTLTGTDKWNQETIK